MEVGFQPLSLKGIVMKSALALAVAIFATTPAHPANKHTSHHLHSHVAKHAGPSGYEKRVLQNVRADKQGLMRYDELSLYLYGWKQLVPLPENEFVGVDHSQVDPKYAFCTPEAAAFILALGEDFYHEFGWRGIIINSALRTVEKQRKEIENGNVNAVSATGPAATMHARANTLDIAYRMLNDLERAFVERWLRRQYDLGRIEYVKEVRSHRMYHASVYTYPTPAALNTLYAGTN